MVKTRLALAGFLSAAVLHAVPALAADSHQSLLHGSLPRGAHAVGFTRLQLADPARPISHPTLVGMSLSPVAALSNSQWLGPCFAIGGPLFTRRGDRWLPGDDGLIQTFT